MIIFVDKSTHKIIGTINGRVHNEAQLKMFIGDKETTERVVFPWVQKIDGVEEVTKEIMEEAGQDLEGNKLYKKTTVKDKIVKKHWEPDFKDKELLIDFDRGRKKISNYLFDLETREFILA